jgi:hypothetical protein
LEDPNSHFSYQEKREALEFFGIRALVWRKEHKPHFSIVSTDSDLVSPLSSRRADGSHADLHS